MGGVKPSLQLPAVLIQGNISQIRHVPIQGWGGGRNVGKLYYGIIQMLPRTLAIFLVRIAQEGGRNPNATSQPPKPLTPISKQGLKAEPIGLKVPSHHNGKSMPGESLQTKTVLPTYQAKTFASLIFNKKC